MAERPVFIPLLDGTELVNEVFLSITWHGGFALVQKKKNIAELHAAATAAGYGRILEVSTKSDEKVGRHLSAFHLKSHTEVGEIPLECAFQGSKVFEQGGPFRDLYAADVRAAKRDARLQASGRLLAFKFGDMCFPLEPKTAFYDWLYLRAIHPHREWLTRLYKYAGFTDIEFNPQRSVNCQARSCALFVSLAKRGLLDEAMESPQAFLKLLVAHRYAPVSRAKYDQDDLFRSAARPVRPKTHECLWHTVEPSTIEAVDTEAIPINDLVRHADFPYSTLDKMVRIKDIIGRVINVSDDGQTLELRDLVTGQVRIFHTRFLRENFGPMV